MKSLLDSQLVAAIVGALLVIIPTYFISKKQENRKGLQKHIAWLNGLLAELCHIEKRIAEINDTISRGGISTMRMNSDFLEKSRTNLFDYNPDIDFLESLTKAYGDVVHTNNMLNRFEAIRGDQVFLRNVMASMQGVTGSVTTLKQKVEQKILGKNAKQKRKCFSTITMQAIYLAIAAVVVIFVVLCMGTYTWLLETRMQCLEEQASALYSAYHRDKLALKQGKSMIEERRKMLEAERKACASHADDAH